MTERYLLHCRCPDMCRFSVAGNDEPTTGTGGRRPKSAKARNRGMWGTIVPRRYGDLAAAAGLMILDGAFEPVGLLQTKCERVGVSERSAGLATDWRRYCGPIRELDASLRAAG